MIPKQGGHHPAALHTGQACRADITVELVATPAGRTGVGGSVVSSPGAGQVR